MEKLKEVKLPSGAVLKIAPSPFSDAKALYQALLIELKTVEVKTKSEMADLWKNLFCIGFSSPRVEACLKVCMQRCLYNDLKIDDDTFEPVNRRQDYLQVCYEVVKENVGPFAKSLYAEFKPIFDEMISNLQ